MQDEAWTLGNPVLEVENSSTRVSSEEVGLGYYVGCFSTSSFLLIFIVVLYCTIGTLGEEGSLEASLVPYTTHRNLD